MQGVGINTLTTGDQLLRPDGKLITITHLYRSQMARFDCGWITDQFFVADCEGAEQLYSISQSQGKLQPTEPGTLSGL